MIFESLSRLLAKLIFLTHLSSAAEILTNPTLTHLPRQQSTDPAYTDDSVFQTTALDNQNFYRVEHGAVNMTWSTSLASSSEAWSEQCIWAHSGSNLPYGESVFGGFDTLGHGIDGWGLERINYNWNDPGFSESTGHFTQIVWKATTQVGCSRTLCGSRGWWVVCHYSPPGNIPGLPDAYTINVGKQISGSPNVGVTGTSNSIPLLPSSPVTIPETPGNAQSGSGSVGLKARRDLVAFLVFWMLVLWALGMLV